MMMEPFHLKFGDVAEKETRCIILSNDSNYNLPSGEFFFTESYCNDPSCDCRRIFINVIHKNKIIATIGYGWESLDFYKKWMGRGGDDDFFDDIKGPVLEPTGNYSQYSDEVLRLFNDLLLNDNVFIERLKRHYEMFKSSLKEKQMDEDSMDDDELEFSDQEIKIFDLLDKARYHRNVSCNDKKAIKICDEILDMDENNRDAMLIKAGALGHIGRNKESLYLINSIKDKWSNHWEAYYLLGLHLFNKNERKAMQAFKKSLELEERFDNLVSAAQLAYFMGKHNYQKYLDKAEKLDSQRFKNFMKTCWTYDLN